MTSLPAWSRPARPPAFLATFAAAALVTLVTAGCLFGGGDDGPPAGPEPDDTAPLAPAIGRSGPTPTPAPLGGRPIPTAEPARGDVQSSVTIVLTHPFIWPAEGPITSFMSPQHPNGIDIGLDHGAMDVRAAAAGTVTFAGGSDDEALGISIDIDHGNGVTTIYGHLDEVLVTIGEQVEIGQVIAVGGSTGISTGNHLHFEVRKNGDTVDPLHVLPSQATGTSTLNVDCATTPFTLPSGSQALVDLSGLLRDQERVVFVEAVSRSGGPALDYAVAERTAVRVITPIAFDGPDGLDSYDLRVTVDDGRASSLVQCGFVVQRREVPTTFYVRAAPPAGDVDTGGVDASEEADEAPGDPAPEPPTPTPGPWPQAPAPVVPGGAAGAGSSAPSYGSPGSSGPGATSPTYGSPGATPTPIP